MRGYRCDNCHAFQPERPNPEKARVMTYSHDPRPDDWLQLWLTDDDVSLHFCSHSCLAAYSEQEARIR